ncbi:coiled-coil domain-containing protein 96 [Syngnathus acus]|uniref:coiled-coil domain-containing protein 96 n=1 Tax=Syngnathus acus TaxID=161584 RepID=UPI001886401F|nr:coiled-coil domain-containing protein 96 [Syngnathus acus]
MSTGPAKVLQNEVLKDTGNVALQPKTNPTREDLNGDVEDIKSDAMLLLQELEEENHKVSRRNMEVQAQLAIHLRRTTPHEQDPEPDMKEYHECLERLTELRKQRASQMGRARQKEEELRLNNQKALNEVENEWRFLVGLKRKLAVSLLREHLSPGAVRAKVDAALGSEQLRRQELRKLRLIHAGVESRVVRLEAKLVEEEEEEGRDLLQRQFKHLLAQRMQQRKADERRSQEASKLQRNIKRTLELLCNIKEKLHWSQTEVQTKREQLAQLEVEITSRRDLLYRTKRAGSGLQRENVELKQTRGLLGNALLLWDFGVTMGDAQRLEDKLEKLKRRREEIASA